MDDTASDDRATQMKLAIIGAFDELSKTRPFSRLGVAAVAKKLGISRSTFYYHFKDRNDAVRWISVRAFEQGIDQIGRTLTWFEGHLVTTRMLCEYRHLITAAAEDISYSGAALFYRRYRTATLEQTLKMRGIELDEDLSFQIAALAAAEQQMTVSFIRGDFGEMSAPSFCKRIASIVPQDLKDALELQ
ncbi:MAG: TetR/AcrR family transcriptional regulator [Coriobacteriales bacterium]|jgi:AcrR family transcriptional regulator